MCQLLDVGHHVVKFPLRVQRREIGGLVSMCLKRVIYFPANVSCSSALDISSGSRHDAVMNILFLQLR
jgi:hypothetical protein